MTDFSIRPPAPRAPTPPPIVMSLWERLVRLGYIVRKNRLDGLKLWNEAKALIKGAQVAGIEYEWPVQATAVVERVFGAMLQLQIGPCGGILQVIEPGSGDCNEDVPKSMELAHHTCPSCSTLPPHAVWECEHFLIQHFRIAFKNKKPGSHCMMAF